MWGVGCRVHRPHKDTADEVHHAVEPVGSGSGLGCRVKDLSGSGLGCRVKDLWVSLNSRFESHK